MGFFGFGKKQTAGAAAATENVPAQIDNMTHVSGVGRHQQILAGFPHHVQVELMPWQQGDAITAKINGQRVGELEYSGELHMVLAAMRDARMPPVLVDGEIRRGDIVPLYLAVNLPSTEELRSRMPDGWAPAEMKVNIGLTSHYQDELAAVYNIKQNRVAEVSFRVHQGGKYDGQPEGVVTLDGHVIGELTPSNEKPPWWIIRSDQQQGVTGRLLVQTSRWHNAAKDMTEYSVVARYKRSQTPVG